MPIKLSELPSVTDGLTGTLQSTMETGSGFDGTLVSLVPAAGLVAFLGLRAARTRLAGTAETPTSA
ncbi:UNVERIFIED_ORG: hypothetical protein E4P37_13835 [Bacillus sp. AZ43]